MNIADITLLKHWQHKQDASAFQELVARHSAMVFATCRRILRNTADAEEVAQECFLALAQTEIKKIRTLGAWLHSAATSRSLDRLRSDKRLEARERHYAESAPTRVDPIWDDIQDFVDEAIEALPEELQTVVIGYFLEGHKQTEIAASMEVSPATVSKRIDRSVTQIREQLRDKGIGVTLALLPALLGEASAEAAPKTLTATLGKLALGGSALASTTPKETIFSGVAAVKTACLIAVFTVSASIIGVVWNHEEFAVIVNETDTIEAESHTAPPEIELTIQTETVVASTLAVVTLAVEEPTATLEPAESKGELVGSIEGLVVDANGKPISDATVSANGNATSGSSSTDSDGNFTLEIYDMSGGTIAQDANDDALFSVRASYPEYLTTNLLRVELGSKDLKLVLTRNGWIRGFVVDVESGRPIPEFDVRIDLVDTGSEGVMSGDDESPGEWINHRAQNGRVPAGY